MSGLGFENSCLKIANKLGPTYYKIKSCAKNVGKLLKCHFLSLPTNLFNLIHLKITVGSNPYLNPNPEYAILIITSFLWKNAPKWRQSHKCLKTSVVDPKWFIPDPDPTLNFPSSGSGSNLY